MNNPYFESISEQTEIDIWNHFGKTLNDVKRDIEAIKTWLGSQPHLPKTLTDYQIQSFLLVGRGSVEKIKPKIDMYFTMRTIFHDIFQDSHPLSRRMLEAKRFIYLIPLPSLGKLYSRTIVLKFKDVADTNNLDFSSIFAYAINMVEIRLLEDLCCGHTIVFDMEHCTMAHCSKITPSFVRDAYAIGERALTTRVYGIHIINAPTYTEQVLFLVKSIVKPKLASKISLHKDMPSFLNSIEKSILPRDYGGNEKSLDDLEAQFTKKYDEYKSFFDLRETLKVNEDMRPSKNVNDDILGYHGNFKKLDVD